MFKKVFISILIFLITLTNYSFSQTVIGIQDFEVVPAAPTMGYTGGNLATGNGLFPNSPKYVSGSQGRQVNNSTTNITFNSVNSSAYTGVFFTCRLASFAGTSGNGADGADYVIVSVSNNGGATWSQELKIIGNNNAKWSFVSGTGIASSVYDGNNATVNFTPAGGGYRTTDGYSTLTVTGLPTVANLRIRLEIKNNSSNEYWVIDDAQIKGTLSAPCILPSEPTTNSSLLSFPTIDCISMNLNWIAGNGANRIVVASTSPVAGTPTDQVAYPANANLGSGSTIAAGEFVVYNGSGTTVTVSGLTQSTTYYFAIFEYNGAIANCEENYLITGTVTGNATTIACVCPEITGILVDACGGTIEGINEFFTFENGNSTLPIDSLTANFPSGGSFCNSGCGTQTWTTNPTFVNTLNTTAGCVGLFVEVDPIPAGGKVIVFTGASPTFNFDFSGLCGTGPYYAIFANNTNTGGRFANNSGSACGIFRTLTVDFSSNCSDAATYERCLLSNSDGDYVAYDAAGNATYANDGCTPIATLPVSLTYFKGNPLKNNTNLLEWSTSSEINNDFFTIERSDNAIEFLTIETIDGKGNSNSIINYQLIDETPINGINYYRLKQTDFNGDFEYSTIIAINNQLSDITIFTTNNTLVIQSNQLKINGVLEILDISGRLIYSEKINTNKKVSTTKFHTGIYIVKLITENSAIIKKVKF